MTIHIPDYWPIIQPGHHIFKEFNEGLTQYWTTDGHGGTQIIQRKAGGEWDNTWKYRNDYARGNLEYEDDYPTHTSKMIPGHEIMWGNDVEIGTNMGNQCVIAGPVPWFPWMWATYGWQYVEFQAIEPVVTVPAGTFQNVLRFMYVQPWVPANSADGGIMWSAPGIGFIKMNWIKAGALTPYWSILQSQGIV